MRCELKGRLAQLGGLATGLALAVIAFSGMGLHLAEATTVHSTGMNIPAPTKPVVQGDKIENIAACPGQVAWHKDFETACHTSRKSGKPVLLIEMLGRLDEEFC